MKLFPSVLLSLSLALTSVHAETKPLRALLITGGCCHDYAKQKDILKEGIEKRLNIVVDQIHTDDKSTKPPIAIYGNPEYAKGYDIVIHDECSASVSDEAVIEGVLAPHKAGIPGVNLHCAMHSYRIGSAGEPATAGTPHGYWFEYLGLQSSGHGPQEPISISYFDPANPSFKGLTDWTTIKEELYNNVKVFDTAQPIAKGKQTVKKKAPKEGEPAEEEKEAVVVWTNLYQGKTRVFSTTIGHNNDTVGDDRYLDLVTRGILWATNSMNADGTPKAGVAK
ncbi:MAG: ThuA domain-containing protein [Verrucomicrobiota bacterium]